MLLGADAWLLSRAYEVQEAVNEIGFERIIECIKEQYVEEKNEIYVGYPNEMIKSILT